MMHLVHYCDVIMGAMASQITSLMIVYSTVYSGADQRKHQSSASLAFVQGILWWSVNSPHKWPVTWKMFPFDNHAREATFKNTCKDYPSICPCQQSHVYIFHGMYCIRSLHTEGGGLYVPSGPRFNIKTSSYQYRKSHCGDRTVVKSSYLRNGISYTGKMTSLCWSSPLAASFIGGGGPTVIHPICCRLFAVLFKTGNNRPQNCI